MQLIESKTLGTAQAQIDFTSVPQDGTDLVLWLSATGSGTGDSLIVRFNNDTGNNYSWRRLSGDGSNTSSDSASSVSYILGPQITTATTTNFGSTSMYVPNYSGNTAKSVSFDGVTETNATTSQQNLLAGLYTQTTAITTVSLRTFNANNFSIGTIASLYKITKGSDGIVTTSP
jgi:hypothetical protein